MVIRADLRLSSTQLDATATQRTLGKPYEVTLGVVYTLVRQPGNCKLEGMGMPLCCRHVVQGITRILHKHALTRLDIKASYTFEIVKVHHTHYWHLITSDRGTMYASQLVEWTTELAASMTDLASCYQQQHGRRLLHNATT